MCSDTASDERTSRMKIEITPEMIEAGKEALWDSDYTTDSVPDADYTVRQIIRKSLAAGGIYVQIREDR